MYKVGQKFLVSILALAGTLPGVLDGAVAIAADNGATVEVIDATSAKVTITAVGNTTISATALAGGTTLSADPQVVSSGNVATVLQMTLTAIADAPAAS